MQTLGIHPEKQTRVLKERRILSGPRTSTPAHPMRCSFRTHLFSRMRFPELPPWAGMPCPLQGKLNDDSFRSCVRTAGPISGPRRGSNPIAQPRVRHHALKGHRIPAQGANPGTPPGKTDPRSEGTPHSLRAADIDPGPPYAVFLQNTPLLSDAVPRVATLGWYALPRWGNWPNSRLT